MKTGDLLSGPTLTASRTLTIYSATVLAIFYTGANLDKFPGIAWLSPSDPMRHNIMAVVLGFLTFAFLTNWLCDIYTDKARAAVDDYSSSGVVNNETMLKEYLRSSDQGETNREKRFEMATRALDLVVGEKLLGFAVRHGLHFVVPFGLAVAASVTLAYNISFPTLVAK